MAKRRKRWALEELKWIDRAEEIPFLAPIDDPIPIYLNIVGPGTGANQRVGNRITCVRLQMKARLTLNTGEFPFDPPTPFPDTPEYARILIFFDRQANGTSGARVTDVLESVSTLAPFYLSDSFENLNNTGRFHMLKDIQILLPTKTASGGPGGYDLSFGILPALAESTTVGGNVKEDISVVESTPKYQTYPAPPYEADTNLIGSITGADVLASVTLSEIDFAPVTATITPSGSGPTAPKYVPVVAELQRFLWSFDINLGSTETVFNSNVILSNLDINSNALVLMLVKTQPQEPLHGPNYQMRINARLLYHDT